VPSEALALARAPQVNKPGLAVRLMDRFQKIKADRQKGKS
jgi:bifunctional UDP-N-acetylglucosamine pyrophosphorylase/glucosamine-1-phosphate N-acetyltransferase